MTAMLFWRPVILPWPARSPWPRWAMIPYLAPRRDFQNTVLAAILTISDRVIYPAYAARASDGGHRRRSRISAMAGVIMWVPGCGRVPRRGGRGWRRGHPWRPPAGGRLQAPLVAGEDPAGGGGVGLLGSPVSESCEDYVAVTGRSVRATVVPPHSAGDPLFRRRYRLLCAPA